MNFDLSETLVLVDFSLFFHFTTVNLNQGIVYLTECILHYTLLACS